jgi:hypothetical protein
LQSYEREAGYGGRRRCATRRQGGATRAAASRWRPRHRADGPSRRFPADRLAPRSGAVGRVASYRGVRSAAKSPWWPTPEVDHQCFGGASRYHHGAPNPGSWVGLWPPSSRQRRKHAGTVGVDRTRPEWRLGLRRERHRAGWTADDPTAFTPLSTPKKPECMRQ